MPDFSLYVILDPRFVHSDNGLYETARAALRGGAGLLQLRDKESTDRELYERASELRAICDEFETPFIVNDRLDIALAVGADGVHLGPEDLPVEAVRRVVSRGQGMSDFRIGGSAGTTERAAQLVEAGVDYLGSGAVYDAGRSKPDASAPRGPEAIGAIGRAVSVPVVGIGGIAADNARPVVEAGADGVAVIRAVVGQPDPETAARELRAAVETGE